VKLLLVPAAVVVAAFGIAAYGIALAAPSRAEALITIRAVNYRVVGDDRTPGSQALYTTLLGCVFIGRGGPLGSGTSECYGTFVIPKGKITVHGSRKSRSFYVLAVTGGTGLYSTARGQLIASTRGVPEGQQKIVISLE
jgi:hypothetical protein